MNCANEWAFRGALQLARVSSPSRFDIALSRYDCAVNESTLPTHTPEEDLEISPSIN